MDITFQLIDWTPYDCVDDDTDAYTILIFGRTMDDRDVCMKVTGFNPFFYVLVPDDWNDGDIHGFVAYLRNWMEYKHDVDYLMDYRIIYDRYRKFFGFCDGSPSRFIKLEFRTLTGMRKYRSAFSYPLKYNRMRKDKIKMETYEANIEPHIRFMHMRKLDPCGWVSIRAKHMTKLTDFSTCDIVFGVHWKNVNPAGVMNKTAPMKIMAYDIECISSGTDFCQAHRKGDRIIQIGATLYRYGSMVPDKMYMIVLGDCSNIDNVDVRRYRTERGLIKGFAKLIREVRPDIICGYNTFGFDDTYIYNRIRLIDNISAEKKGVHIDFLQYSLMNDFYRTAGKLCPGDGDNGDVPLASFIEKELKSSALGDNIMRYFSIPGVLSIDMMKVIQRDHKLTRYSLDHVSSTFISERVTSIDFGDIAENERRIVISTSSSSVLEKQSFIHLVIDDGYSPTIFGDKMRVIDILNTGECTNLITRINEKYVAELSDILKDGSMKVRWSFAKDDIHVSDMNTYYASGDPDKIAIIAKYCVQDCRLVNLLMAKLDVVVYNASMANVCFVPLSYIFLRGQGVKVFSLVARKCRERKYLIPTKSTKIDDESTYEGATVIKPTPGVYTDPIGVLDYNALYPNSIRERNLSPECHVIDDKYRGLDGYIYHDVRIIKKDGEGRTILDDNGNELTENHTFAQKIVSDDTIEEDIGDLIKSIMLSDNTIERKKELIEMEKAKRYNKIGGVYVKYGILPEVLTDLLNARKDTNNRLSIEKDPFVKSILNSLQIAYKVTANSLYGQTGAKTSPIYYIAIASCTTSIGRTRLHEAKHIVEDKFRGSRVIYGDTDSIFINFNLRERGLSECTELLTETIKLSKEAAGVICKTAPRPQVILYEKVYYPFILMKRKKYVGILYRESPVDGYISSMGTVLKRRDYAPIVKTIVGGIINSILTTKDVDAAVSFTNTSFQKIIKGEYPMDKFILSKTLKSSYKNPTRIAHNVLAERIGFRDPGNKPQANDRIQYVYIVNRSAKKNALRGDFIETPAYIEHHRLQIDYHYYMVNQIIQPTSQILGLILNKSKLANFFDRHTSSCMATQDNIESMSIWMKHPTQQIDSVIDRKEADQETIVIALSMNEWLRTKNVRNATTKKRPVMSMHSSQMTDWMAKK